MSVILNQDKSLLTLARTLNVKHLTPASQRSLAKLFEKAFKAIEARAESTLKVETSEYHALFNVRVAVENWCLSKSLEGTEAVIKANDDYRAWERGELVRRRS